MRTVMFLAVMACAAAIAGCGAGGSAATPVADAGVDGKPADLDTPTGVCAEWMRRTGAYLARCQQLASPSIADLWQPYACPRLLASIAAKRVTFDAAAAKLCFNGFAECSGPMGLGCSGTSPNVALGGACSVFALAPECKGDAFCQPAGSASCLGTCVAAHTQGQACGSSRECAPLLCDTTGHCGPFQPGQPRIPSEMGQSCAPVNGEAVRCVYGTACDAVTATCLPSGKPGDTCGAGSNIACGFDSSARCDATTKTCVICSQ